MDATNFTYWLQGYFEILAAAKVEDESLSGEQVACIKEHLAMVLSKVTRSRDGSRDQLKKLGKPSVYDLTSCRDDLLC